jgi:rhamnogalacturonan endolyase
MGDLVYEPPRDGPTLWEIGIPDRSAAEFFVPDPDPKYINKLYISHPDRLAHFLLQFFSLKESVVCYPKIRGEQ